MAKKKVKFFASNGLESGNIKMTSVCMIGRVRPGTKISPPSPAALKADCTGIRNCYHSDQLSENKHTGAWGSVCTRPGPTTLVDVGTGVWVGIYTCMCVCFGRRVYMYLVMR